MAQRRSSEKRVTRDLVLVTLSIVAAILIVKTSAVHAFVGSFYELKYLGSFIAGAFFTSVFTTAPAIAVLGELAQSNSIYFVAIVGGLGAMTGDFLLFRFVRDTFSEDVRFVLSHSRIWRYHAIFKTKLSRWIMPLIGAVIIASPFPDEIGLTMLGLSKISNKVFFLLSFAFNAAGILIIGWIANSA